MKKLLKRSFYVLFSITTIVIIAFDPIAEKLTKNYIQDLVKTPVKISQFDSDWLDKSININFIEVQNPKKFKNKNAISVDSFYLKIGSETNSDLIVIDDLAFDGINFIVEQKALSINLATFVKNLEKSKTKPSKNDEISIKINNLRIIGTKLTIDTKLLKKQIKVPDIRLKNVGGNKGIKSSKIGPHLLGLIFKSLKKSLKKQGLKADKQKLKKKLGLDNFDKLNRLKGKLKAEGEKLKTEGKKLLEKLGF